MIGRGVATAGALTLLGLALALTGCSVGPKFVKPETTLNDNWEEHQAPQVTARSAADSTWWQAFNDSTLDQLVHLAYQQNLPLEVSGLRILEARAQLALAAGRKYPQIQAAFGSATAIGLSEHAAYNVGIDSHFWDYQLGFDAIWELDFWGKYSRGVEAQSARYFGTVADYDNALVSLTAEVARTYAEIRTFEVLIEQARRNASLQEEGLRIAEARFRHGATSELDVAQATTLLESTRATIPQLESGLQQAENALCTLIGQPTGSVRAILGEPKGIPVAPGVVAISVPVELLRRRPDIRGAELHAAEQAARVGVSQADLYPSFSLAGSIGTQISSGTESDGGSLFGPGSLFYTAGARVFWPLFNYGRLRNSVRIEDARLQQLLVDYRNTVLKAAQEVEDELTGYLKAQEAAVFARNAATGAQRSVDLANVQYREGAVDYQRVLDAQRSLLQEENNLAQTQSSIATNLIALYKALGGGWEIRQGQPFVDQTTQTEMEDRTNWGDLISTQPAPETSNGSSPD
jgi:NodT family efflux transporter outer membrane factor (OMF) lipoprotein